MCDEKGILSYDAYCETENDIFISSNCMNGLVCIDKATGSSKYVKKFDDTYSICYLKHRQAIRNGNDIIFVPNFCDRIHIFNIITKEIRYVVIKKDEWKDFRCVDSFIWKDKLWLILSYMYNGIVSVDLEKYKVEYFSEVYSAFLDVLYSYDEPIFWEELYKQEDGIVYGVVDRK